MNISSDSGITANSQNLNTPSAESDATPIGGVSSISRIFSAPTSAWGVRAKAESLSAFVKKKRFTDSHIDGDEEDTLFPAGMLISKLQNGSSGDSGTNDHADDKKEVSNSLAAIDSLNECAKDRAALTEACSQLVAPEAASKTLSLAVRILKRSVDAVGHGLLKTLSLAATLEDIMQKLRQAGVPWPRDRYTLRSLLVEPLPLPLSSIYFQAGSNLHQKSSANFEPGKSADTGLLMLMLMLNAPKHTIECNVNVSVPRLLRQDYLAYFHGKTT